MDDHAAKSLTGIRKAKNESLHVLTECWVDPVMVLIK